MPKILEFDERARRALERGVDKLADAVGFRYAYDEAIDQYAHPAAVTVLTPKTQAVLGRTGGGVLSGKQVGTGWNIMTNIL